MKLTPGMFIAKVVGKSMEPTINDGSYCIFRFHPGGSRNGQVVLVESDLVTDPELGTRYTVKRYHSGKEFFDNGTWRHKEIILSPDNKVFSDIVLKDVRPGDFRVIAEFLRQY
ncbi:MAG: S24 family peptidase [Candidatus Omnitrophica bacterium]|nr:S24 family peptidase [Candidatus Omnitrophota bacterium]